MTEEEKRWLHCIGAQRTIIGFICRRFVLSRECHKTKVGYICHGSNSFKECGND